MTTSCDERGGLEARLTDLAGAVVFPASPQVRDRVLMRLRGGAAPRRRISVRRRVVVALMAVLTMFGASLAAPPFREALAGWLGLHGVTIRQLPGPLSTPRPTPTPAVSATPGPAGSGLDLGSPVTLAEARRTIGFAPLLPARLGEPDAAWLRRPPPLGALSLVYRPGPGRPAASGTTGISIIVTEFRANLDTQVLGKFLGSDATAAPVSVGTDVGVWITGAPHDVGFTDDQGSVAGDSLRLATNTLLWQHGALLLRIEGPRSLDEALTIAASLR